MATAAATLDAAGQRLPSTRPIDCRWDRSRGILFSSAKRPTLTPSPSPATWSPANGIVFSQTPATNRSYAQRKIGGQASASSTPTASRTPNPSRPSTTSFEDAHTGGGLGSDFTQQVALLTSTIKEQKSKNDDLRREADRLDKEVRQVRAERDDHKKTIDDIKSTEKELRKQFADANAQLQAARTKHINELDAQRKMHAQEQSDLNSKWAQQLETLREETDPDRKENERVLADIHEKAVEAATSSLESEYQEKYDAKAKYLQSQNDARLQRFEKREQRNENLRIELESKRQQYLSRQERGKIDRADYTVYRKLHLGLGQSIYELNRRAYEVAKNLETASVQWQQSAKKFLDSPVLALFHQMAKYKDLKLAVLQYLDGRSSDTDAAAKDLVANCNRLVDDNRALEAPLHDSRSLTRYLRFRDEPELVSGLDLVHKFLHLDPLRAQNQRLFLKAKDLRKDVREDRHKFKEIVRQHDEVVLMVKFSSAVFQITALEALLLDDPVEKMVYLRSAELSNQLVECKRRYDDILDKKRRHESGTAEQVKEGEKLYKKFRDMDQKARRGVDEFEMQLRKRAMLEAERGALSAQEAGFDSEIATMIEKLEVKRDAALAELLSSRKPPLITARTPATLSPRTSALARPKLHVTPKIVSASLVKRRTKLGDMSEDARAALIRSFSRSRLESLRSCALWNIRALIKKKDEGTSNMSDSGLNSQLAGLEKRIVELDNRLENMPITDAEEESDPSGSNTSPRTAVRLISRPPGRTRRARLQAEAGAKPATGVLRFEPTLSRQASHAGMPFGTYQTWDIQQSNQYGDLLADDFFAGNAALKSSLLLGSTQLRYASSKSDEPGPSEISESSDAPNSSGFSSSGELSHSDHLAVNNSEPEDQLAIAESDDALAECSESVAESDESVVESDDAPESQTELAYQIPLADYRTAVMASPNTQAAFWSHKMYKSVDGKYPVVMYCQNFDAAEAQAKLFLDEPVLGFDLEWEPFAKPNSGIKQNISLVQIAAEDKILLCHIARFTGTTAAELLPPSLRKLLESPDAIKAGVNVTGDMRRVKDFLGVDMKGVFELSHLYKLVKFSASEPSKVNFRLIALATQVQDVLLLPLKKDDNRMSSWSRVLRPQQSDYAASDAYAGFRLFHRLDYQRKAMKPTPPRPAFYETHQPLVLGDGSRVIKGQKKPGAKQATAGAATAEDADEESEEFFDAIEELDPYELASSDSPAAEIAYPPLPQVLNSVSNAPVDDQESPEPPIMPAAPVSTSPLPDVGQLAKSRPSTSKITRPDTQETRDAEVWVEAFRSSCAADYKLVARSGELRAYHLWHEQRLSVSDVAALMKDPPLTLTTVASYVMQCIKEENLPFDTERLRREVLVEIPKSVHSRYYKVLNRMEEAKGV